MSDTTTPDDPKAAQQALWASLITSLTTSAMFQLGKLRHPATGETALDLEGAQYTIDLLEMLEARTQGHLDDQEARALRDAIMTLQLAYVETRQAGGAASPEPSASQPDVKPESEPALESTGSDKPPAEEKVKYHKSYA